MSRLWLIFSYACRRKTNRDRNMGRYIHVAEHLLPPLCFLDERMFHLRSGKSLYTVPTDPMVLLFLDANHDVVLPEPGNFSERTVHAPLHVVTGDICVFPANLPRIYRRHSPPKNTSLRTTKSTGESASRIHVLRVLFRFPVCAAADQSAPDNGASLSLPDASDAMQFVRDFVSEFRHLPGGITPAVHERITTFRQEVETGAPGYHLRMSAIWLDFVVECARAMTSAGKSQMMTPKTPAGEKHTNRADVLVQRTKQFLVENHASPLTLDEIAWQAKLSREHVARTFRQQTGQTVFDYLARVRIEAAQQLLTDSALPVTEIAHRTGFSSPTLFGRVFKRLIGQTPQAYRQEVLSQVRFRPSILL
ncbi:AraC family transcriptional regulator [Opitutaceae bacterium TAV4]|nr:AraC family transcriptional regulator [Opitutaceae bacterium TAV3]RRK01385.1 AraC family transcriptional regulator [Opitutaceae bacterium TAV4]